MAKGDVDLSDEALELRGGRHEARELRDEAAFSFAQGRRIVAQDVERPEHQKRAAQMLDHLRMAKADHLDDALERPFLADGLRRKHVAVDESDDERTRLMMHDLRRQPRRMGRERGRALIEAHHLMAGNVVADAHDEALAAMAHEEIGVGEAAAERLGGDGAAPERKAFRNAPGSFWGKDATAGEGAIPSPRP